MNRSGEFKYDISYADIIFTLFVFVNSFSTIVFLVYAWNCVCNMEFRPVFIMLASLDIILLIIKRYVYYNQEEGRGVLLTVYTAKLIWLIGFVGLVTLVFGTLKSECDRTVKIYSYLTLVCNGIILLYYCISKIVYCICDILDKKNQNNKAMTNARYERIVNV